MVGCVYYEPPDAADNVVLIDPLAPPEGTSDHERFWRALDRDVLGTTDTPRPTQRLVVLLSNDWHERSAQAVYDRYRERTAVSVWAHEEARGRVACAITDVARDGDVLPGGVQAHEIGAPYPSEIAFYLPPYNALVCADSVIGAGEGRVRIAPPWWAGKRPDAQERYRTRLRPALRRLLDLPLELLLTSHGPPVLQGGHAALAESLDAPAWGED